MPLDYVRNHLNLRNFVSPEWDMAAMQSDGDGLHCCRVLRKVKETFGVPIITDIHDASQVPPAACSFPCTKPFLLD